MERTGLILSVLLMAAGTVAEEKATSSVDADVKAPAAVETKASFNAAGSQMISISYGYVMTDYEDATNDAEGWRISGTFEKNHAGTPLVHGVTIGFIETSAERSGIQTVNYEAKTIPLYYAPKIILGKKAIKVFVKGALGTHFTDYSRSGGTAADVSADEFGFYGGGGLGAMLVLKDKFFINAEYEWIYMSNSYFQDGALQSAMVGIGMQL